MKNTDDVRTVEYLADAIAEVMRLELAGRKAEADKVAAEAASLFGWRVATLSNFAETRGIREAIRTLDEKIFQVSLRV